jgi:hypothetical protein
MSQRAGPAMNLCTTCGEDFGSVESFDAHRVGNYPQRGPSEYEGSIEDWTPSRGRRCLTVDEMERGSFQARQFVRNSRGRWSLQKRLERSRESFSTELPTPERHAESLGAAGTGKKRRTAPAPAETPAEVEPEREGAPAGNLLTHAGLDGEQVRTREPLASAPHGHVKRAAMGDRS